MKKLLLLGAALFGLCAVGQSARAGADGPAYSNDRPAPRYYEGQVVGPRVYLPPPPPIFFVPPPFAFLGFPGYHHRHFYPYGYGYGRRVVHGVY